MLSYWPPLRYSFLRTLILLAADLRRQPMRGVPVIPRAVSLSCFYKSIYRHLGNTPHSLYCLIRTFTQDMERGEPHIKNARGLKGALHAYVNRFRVS